MHIAHQVTAFVRNKLQAEAYIICLDPNAEESLNDWCERLIKESPTFQF